MIFWRQRVFLYRIYRMKGGIIDDEENKVRKKQEVPGGSHCFCAGILIVRVSAFWQCGLCRGA